MPSSIQATPEAQASKRTLTPSAFALLLVFALSSYAGINIVRFEALAHRIWLGPADEPLTSVLDSVSAWTGTSSVATIALSTMLDLRVAEAPNDKASIEVALQEVAAAAPTSTAVWLSLADMRQARHAPMEDVLTAFRMSALTGSHEGFFMMQRATFGLLHWSDLPEEGRQIVVRDIVSSVGPANGVPRARYREILTRKPAAERENIKETLLASGLASKDLLKALGV
jgi:hypothetical protein